MLTENFDVSNQQRVDAAREFVRAADDYLNAGIDRFLEDPAGHYGG